MDIQDVEENFKSLQQFSDSQYKLIEDLTKKVNTLKAENDSLQQMLTGNLPNLEFGNDGHIGISNEQLICETQICLLKDKACKGELNADETRKFATFVDVLEKLRKNKSDKDMSLTKMSDVDILKLVVSNVNSNTK